MIREPWLNKYGLGIAEVDSHHRMLFEFVSRLDAALPTADGWVVVQQTLNDLGFWARVHFAVEESLMRLVNFPDIEHHVALHAEFTLKVARLKKQSARKDITRDASVLLHDWLRHHIDVEDRKYAEHLLGRFGVSH